MKTFSVWEREGYLNRLVRHLLSEPGRPTLDVVDQKITTPYDDPEKCTYDDVVGSHHVWNTLCEQTDLRHEYECGKCGARQLIVWRPQPSFLRVALGL